MELSARKSNIIYTTFLVITIPLFFMFITSRYWYSAIYSSFTEDYNTVRSIGGYHVKVSNAIYLTDTNQFKFTYAVKEIRNSSAEGEKPFVKDVWLDNINGSLNFNTDSKGGVFHTVICDEAHKDFKAVVVRIVFNKPEIVHPDTYDEFGDVIPGKTEKGEQKVERITIDKRDILFMTTAEEKTMTTTKTITTITENNETSTYTSIYTSESSISDQSSVLKSSQSQTKFGNNETKTTTKKTTTKKITVKQSSTNFISSKQNSYTVHSQQTTANHIKPQPETKTQVTTKYTTKPTMKTTTKASTIQQRVISIRLKTIFNNNNVVLSVGKSTKVVAIVEPETAINKKVNWYSSQPKIATVDNNGIVVAKSVGKAIIQAITEDGNLTAACMVTVN